ncbi:SCO2322 family protein [Streptomyces gossypii]|uniref:SCO2322 family protein n=1 Tax=Streptomyces gossypii TaxID=2883101 RepID=UPI002882DAC4|nr:SCO2322 family protein [Streptomyces gossypii]
MAGLLGSLLALTATPAHADGYRYWSFWEQQSSEKSENGKQDDWKYATQGPSLLRPDDGAVVGFRFSVSEDSADAAKPRGAADFDAICADTPEKSGSKRIALVVDFGTAADARSGEQPPEARTACARVGGDASAADALAAEVKPLRYSSDALLCAIAGYPESGCGEQVSGSGKDADGADGAQGKQDARSPDDSAASDGGGDGGGLPTGLGVAAGAGAVLLLAAGAVWQSRRRRG